MLWTIIAVLLAVWLIGNLASFTAGGLIHLLLVLALAAFVVQLFTGRRVV